MRLPFHIDRDEVLRVLDACLQLVNEGAISESSTLDDLELRRSGITDALTATTPSRFAALDDAVIARARTIRCELEGAHVRVLDAMAKMPGDPETNGLVKLMQELVRDRRFEDAATLYTKLASLYRDRTEYVAHAHYLRGMSLLEDGAPTEARHELRRAIAVDPRLDAAQIALESMTTTRLKKL